MPCSIRPPPLTPPNISPDIEVTDEYGVVHRVWKISDPRPLSRRAAADARSKLIIADGHHRYETALTYRNERRAAAERARAFPLLRFGHDDLRRHGSS
jgi:uncharacterized protein (DUF1015 family)